MASADPQARNAGPSWQTGGGAAAESEPALEALVAAVLRQMLGTAADSSPTSAPSRSDDGPIRPGRIERVVAEVVEELWRQAPLPAGRPLPGLDRLADPSALPAWTKSTPSRIAVGRAGLRYPTATYLHLRADHGVAKEAVASVATPEFVRGLGAVELHTKAADLQTFLLEPNQGRQLDDASLQRLRAEGTRGADVQIILADGLSAWAAERNPGLLSALQAQCAAAGFSVGKPIFVHRARIAVADQIGVELAAKATVIGLGERPGLGTGDSLSLYLAWNPKIGQDNAEKNCISNVRPAGISVADAAKLAVQILSRARELGQGGLAVAAPQRTY